MAILLSEFSGAGVFLGSSNFTSEGQGIVTGYDTNPKKGEFGGGVVELNQPVLFGDLVQLRISSATGYAQLFTSSTMADGSDQILIDPFIAAMSAIPAGAGNKLQLIVNGVTYETANNITVRNATGISSTSILNARNDATAVQVTTSLGAPATLADGDVIEYDSKTTPGNYDVTVNTDGTYSIDLTGVSGVISQQTFNARVLSVESGVWVSGGFTTQTIVESSAPGQVTGLVATAGNLSIGTSWSPVSASPSLTKYVIEWKLASASVWQSADVLPNVTTHNLTGLTASLAYDVRVAAVNSIGQGSYSAVGQATPGILNGIVSVDSGLAWVRGGSYLVHTLGVDLYTLDEVVIFSQMFEYRCDFEPINPNLLRVFVPLSMPNGDYGLKIRRLNFN